MSNFINKEDALTLVKNAEGPFQDLKFEYHKFDNGFYINILGETGISRIIYSSEGYIDMEAIGENGDLIRWLHLENRVDLEVLTTRFDELLELTAAVRRRMI